MPFYNPGMAPAQSSQETLPMSILSEGKEISQCPIELAHQNFGGLENTFLNEADLKRSMVAMKVPQKQAKMEFPRFSALQ